MPVPDETRVRLSRWCAARVPAGSRAERQIGYTIHGDEITVVDRRPPTFPELGAAWTSAPVARLRADDPGPGRWSLYLPAEEGSWERSGPPENDPVALLDRLAL